MVFRGMWHDLVFTQGVLTSRKLLKGFTWYTPFKIKRLNGVGIWYKELVKWFDIFNTLTKCF